MKTKKALIAVGGAACKVLSKINTNTPKIFIDTDPNVIGKYNGIRIGQKQCGAYSAQGNSEAGELSVRESKTRILNLLKKYTNVIIVAALGGGTSCGATKRIAELAVENAIETQAIISIPLRLEESRRKKAIHTFYYLKKTCRTIDIGSAKVSDPITLNDYFLLQDNLFIEKILKELN